MAMTPEQANKIIAIIKMNTDHPLSPLSHTDWNRLRDDLMAHVDLNFDDLRRRFPANDDAVDPPACGLKNQNIHTALLLADRVEYDALQDIVRDKIVGALDAPGKTDLENEQMVRAVETLSLVFLNAKIKGLAVPDNCEDCVVNIAGLIVAQPDRPAALDALLRNGIVPKKCHPAFLTGALLDEIRGDAAKVDLQARVAAICLNLGYAEAFVLDFIRNEHSLRASELLLAVGVEPEQAMEIAVGADTAERLAAVQALVTQMVPVEKWKFTIMGPEMLDFVHSNLVWSEQIAQCLNFPAFDHMVTDPNRREAIKSMLDYIDDKGNHIQPEQIVDMADLVVNSDALEGLRGLIDSQLSADRFHPDVITSDVLSAIKGDANNALAAASLFNYAGIQARAAIEIINNVNGDLNRALAVEHLMRNLSSSFLARIEGALFSQTVLDVIGDDANKAKVMLALFEKALDASAALTVLAAAVNDDQSVALQKLVEQTYFPIQIDAGVLGAVLSSEPDRQSAKIGAMAALLNQGTTAADAIACVALSTDTLSANLINYLASAAKVVVDQSLIAEFLSVPQPDRRVVVEHFCKLDATRQQPLRVKELAAFYRNRRPVMGVVMRGVGHFNEANVVNDMIEQAKLDPAVLTDSIESGDIPPVIECKQLTLDPAGVASLAKTPVVATNAAVVTANITNKKSCGYEIALRVPAGAPPQSIYHWTRAVTDSGRKHEQGDIELPRPPTPDTLKKTMQVVKDLMGYKRIDISVSDNTTRLDMRDPDGNPHAFTPRQICFALAEHYGLRLDKGSNEAGKVGLTLDRFDKLRDCMELGGGRFVSGPPLSI